jgi:hypothetical protein
VADQKSDSRFHTGAKSSPQQLDQMNEKVSMKKVCVLGLVTLVCLANCGFFSRRVKLDEEFTLKPNEKVSVSGTGLTIQLKTVGHQWYTDRRAESPYVELVVTGGKAPSGPITLGEKFTVGDYTLKLVGANPFRDNGGPDCKLVVSRK